MRTRCLCSGRVVSLGCVTAPLLLLVGSTVGVLSYLSLLEPSVHGNHAIFHAEVGENVFLCIGHMSCLVQTSITSINVYKGFRGTIIHVFVSVFPHSLPLAKIERKVHGTDRIKSDFTSPDNSEVSLLP